MVLAALSLALAGCRSAPTAPPPPVFYPPLPERPRIQFLRSLSSSADVLPEPGLLARLVFGTEADAESAPVRPYGIAWHQGWLYVCDSGGRRGMVFDFERRAFRTFGDRGPHRLALPVNISLQSAR